MFLYIFLILHLLLVNHNFVNCFLNFFFCFSRGEFVYLSKDEDSEHHSALGGAVPQYQKARRIPLIIARERHSARGASLIFSFRSNSATPSPTGSGCAERSCKSLKINLSTNKTTKKHLNYGTSLCRILPN